MKLQKTVTVKEVKTQKLADKVIKQADDLGHRYLTAKAEESVFAGMAAEANLRIKGLAQCWGKPVDNERLIEGKTYVVGYTTVPNYDINEEKIRALVDEETAKKLFPPALDKMVLSKLVETGVISRKEFAKCIKPKEPTLRIIVRTKEKDAAKKENRPTSE
jgi:hypothetical protein